MTGNLTDRDVNQHLELSHESKLDVIPRKKDRSLLGLNDALPFVGFDWLNYYELTWLDKNTGWPEIRILSIVIPSSSINLIECNSLKTYLASFSNSRFTEKELMSIIEKDLSEILDCPIHLQLNEHSSKLFSQLFTTQQSICLDNFPTTCSIFHYDPSLLKLAPQKQHEEASYFKYETHLFRTMCAETLEPSWATIELTWLGKALQPESLYQYLISFRLHHEFNESSIERIFMDLYRLINPKSLTVRGFFSRRGSLDINPCRSMFMETPIFRRYPRH
jgi:7-cyano-7-deazaguanine reductase